jgi:hypothetical protein
MPHSDVVVVVVGAVDAVDVLVLVTVAASGAVGCSIGPLLLQRFERPPFATNEWVGTEARAMHETKPEKRIEIFIMILPSIAVIKSIDCTVVILWRRRCC